jgi:hypothetical protein
MKTTIEFNFPEDRTDHIIAIHALDFALVCWDMDIELRGWLKHGHELKTADDALAAMRKKLHDFLDIHNVNLDMIE